MIQIDDAGNGAVLGGEVIGALRVETGEYFHKVLPLSAYGHFELPRTFAARDAVMELLAMLKAAPGEPIVFCTGDVFKEAKNFLTAKGIPWQEEKITGTLQELVEASYFNSLRKYGLPEKFRAFHHDYHRFHTLVLNWVSQDLTRRRPYCKPLRLNSGLVSRAKVYRTLTQKKQGCVVCGNEIPLCSVAVLDKTGESPVYYHENCFPAGIDLTDYQEIMLAGEPARSFINKFPAGITCTECGEKIKYKKRVIYYTGRIYHFKCFAPKVSDFA